MSEICTKNCTFHVNVLYLNLKIKIPREMTEPIAATVGQSQYNMGPFKH